MTKKGWFGIGVLVILLAGGAGYWLQMPHTSPVVVDTAVKKSAQTDSHGSDFTGVASCVECHEVQYQLWQGSHHDLAMQAATETTMLGDFNDASHTYYGVTSRFYRNGNLFMVNTDGPDGTMQDFEIKYTFGFFPLQQYLIELPGNKLQALGIAWDSRSIEDGGQRWFHLYPESQVDYRDELHWTGLNQNWNYMCAECHSTNLKKNYNISTGQFETTWSEINVACEACHGPGATHISWAEGSQQERLLDQSMGLSPLLRERAKSLWPIDQVTGTARRSEPRLTEIEINTCARCHSRRGIVAEDYVPASNFMDTHRPSLLSEGLYYADGQILDEVYVYGSFRQSKMYHAGVTCSDCHDAHSLKLKGTRETVCLQCHLIDKYASESHHFHPTDSSGSSCVGCHMPEKKYMVVDPRYDHSMRVPRPDLSVKLGVPNACNMCHKDQTNEWSVDYVRQWYPQPTSGFQDFAEALSAGRRADPEAAGLLLDLLAKGDQPAIARATALQLLGQFPVPQSLQVISDSLYDADPMVRFSGVQTLEVLQPNIRYQLGAHLLNDPFKTVRIEAARVLVGTPGNQLSREQKLILDRVTDEYLESLQINSERPEALVSMGNLFARKGQFAEAERAFLAAVDSEEQFAPAYVNLADLYRVNAREQDAQSILKSGLEGLPEEPSLHHALGLSLIRSNQRPAAVDALARAAVLASDNVRYSYIYAIALDAIGKTPEAIDVLAKTYARDSNAQEVLGALIGYLQKTGRTMEATSYQAMMNDWQQRFSSALGAGSGK